MIYPMFELIGKITYLFNKKMQYNFNYLVSTVNKQSTCSSCLRC